MTPEAFETRCELRARVLCRSAEPHAPDIPCQRHAIEAGRQLRSENPDALDSAASSSPVVGPPSMAVGGDTGGSQGRGSRGSGQAVQELPTSDEAGPLCGDPTCESPSCTQAAIDAWGAQMQENARVAVRQALGLPL